MITTGEATHRPLLFQGVRFGLSDRVGDVLVADGAVAGCGESGTVELPTGGLAIPGRGGTLLPGLRDRHVHAEQWAIALRRVDLTTTTSATHAMDIVAAFLDSSTELAPDDLVIGYGFRDGLWPDIPHKDLLQRRFPDAAIAMVSNDLHTIWASPAALAHLGLEHATGVLREEEAFGISPLLNGASTEQLDEWVLQSLQHLPELGITSLMDFEVGHTVDSWRRRRAIASTANGRLPVRVECSVWPPYVQEILDRGLRTGSPVDPGVDEVTVGYAKVMLDGSLNTRTAYCHDPYPGTPADAAEPARGLLLEDPAELERRMRAAAPHGLHYAVHAIGDAANRIALDCFEATGTSGRIEHAQFIHPDDLTRFAAPGLVAGVQPAHAAEDRDIAEHHWAGRTGNAYPYGAVLAAGGRLEFGSDAPVSALNPWYVMASAITRSIDDRPAWHPEHALTLPQALAACTDGRTTVATGDPGDLVLIADDLTRLTPEQLTDVTVLATAMAGRITYARD